MRTSIDFGSRSLPVLGAERVQGQVSYSEFTASPDGVANRLEVLGVGGDPALPDSEGQGDGSAYATGSAGYNGASAVESKSIVSLAQS